MSDLTVRELMARLARGQKSPTPGAGLANLWEELLYWELAHHDAAGPASAGAAQESLHAARRRVLVNARTTNVHIGSGQH